jgi:hypothetical protein
MDQRFPVFYPSEEFFTVEEFFTSSLEGSSLKVLLLW